MKENYLKGFDGTAMLLQKFRSLVEQCDKDLLTILEQNEMEIFHFGFRWIYCLLLREFPFFLSTKLMDYYLVQDINPGILAVYFSTALLLKYAFRIKSMKREEIMMFLQSLPTSHWGEQDIRLLVSEAMTLKNIFKTLD
jgi:hypothetical protein